MTIEWRQTTPESYSTLVGERIPPTNAQGSFDLALLCVLGGRNAASLQRAGVLSPGRAPRARGGPIPPIFSLTCLSAQP